MSTQNWKVIDHDEAVSHIGAGTHTALRKAGTAPGHADLWKAIDVNIEAWRDAVEFCLYGLKSMDMAICEKVETEDTPSEDAVEIIAAVPMGARPMHSTTLGDETAREIVQRLSEAGLLASQNGAAPLTKVTEDLPEGSYVVDARDIMWKRGDEKWWSGGDSPSSPKDFDRMLSIYGPLRLIRVGGQS